MQLLKHIQFLRALSVLLVFFFHTQPEFFKNGFIGVDVFFVISGFVITSRIYLEHEKSNSFNFYNFYIKRIKRIFPALIFILSAILLVILIFQPVDLLLGNILVYSFTIFGLSNIYYLYSNKDYFDNVFEDIFGHTWSLGVEEQFYFLFPLFFILLIKFIKNLDLRILSLFFLVLVGIILTHYFSENTKLIFYSPIFRFWEFILGSMIFIITKKKYNKSVFIFNIAIIFLIIISIDIGLFEDYQLTILSTISASLFLLFYDQNKFSKLFFENNFVVFIGNISYSFYLWHLPIIYFYDLYFVENILKIPALLTLTIFLSYLTFTFIEQKFRSTELNLNINLKKIVFIFSIFFLILCSVNYIGLKKSYDNNIKKNIKDFIYKINYLENKIDYSNRTVFYKINIDGNEVYRFCQVSSEKKNFDSNKLIKECLRKGKFDDRFFFVSGNSHTVMYLPVLEKVIGDDNSLYIEIKSNPFENINFDKINFLSKKYKEVVLVTYLIPGEIKKIKMIKKLLNPNIKILFIGPVPNIKKEINPLKCFIKNIECSYLKSEDYVKRNLKSYYNDIDKIFSENKNMLFYDPYNIICSTENCKVYSPNQKILTHRDNSHLTIEGSLMLQKDFEKFYKKRF